MTGKLKPVIEPIFGENYYPECEFAEENEECSYNRLCTQLTGHEGCANDGHYWCSVATAAGICPKGLK